MRNWTRPLTLLLLAGLLAFFGLPATGEQTPGDKPKPEAPKPATHKVEKGPFKVEVTLKGVFEADHVAEIALRPEAWSPQSGGLLVLRKVAEHGTPVKKGEPILWLDTEKLDQQIRDLETDRQMAELAIRLAEEELPLLEKATPHELASAERAKRIADEDLKKYVEHDRALMEKITHFRFKNSSNMVDYVKEELRQLEKMYKAKELTEETEEIILRRQRHQVEAAMFYLKMAEIDRDETLKIDLPRRDQSMKDGAEKATLAYDKARTTLPLALNQKRLGLAKIKLERERANERLEKLKRDREMMIVKAPSDGVVYHGKSVRGQWQGGSERLRVGGMIQPDDVLLTVVTPKAAQVRAEVEEKDLHYLQSGQKARVIPTVDPDARLAAKVDKVLLVPVSAGKFDVRFTLADGKETPRLMPGMACSIKLVPYLKEKAISVPASAVFTDELNEDKHYVYLASKDGKSVKRPVVVGKKIERKVEIVEGLKEGEEILLEKPGESKKPDAPSKEAKP